MQPTGALSPTDAQPAGWYPDPWGQPAQWRWWTGRTWTPHVETTASPVREPRLPAWLSVPILIGAVVIVPILGYTAVTAPLAIALGIVPALIVCPVLIWLDRIEPEPRAERVHAFLWGAVTATAVAIVINSIVGIVAGDVIATVVSAPVVEEAMKAGAIVWAVRRLEVDGVMDGVIYAGWAGIGFAVVEDVLYFSDALVAGDLALVFVVRAILSPFAHPLFTMWIGLGVGWAISRNRSILLPALGGYVIAVVSHAMWNGSLVAADSMGGGLFLLVTAILFVTLFVGVTVSLIRLRRGEERRFIELVPWMSQRYGIEPAEVAVFGHVRQMRAARARLPTSDRHRFDQVHSALARLALLHSRSGTNDPKAEPRLVDQLHRARSGGT
jgi:protease PrsW